MTEPHHVDDLIPFFVMGTLAAHEQTLVQQHVAHCERCKLLLAEMQSTAELVPYAMTPVQPSPRVKQALMARVHADLRATLTKPAILSLRGWLAWFNQPHPALTWGSVLLLIVLSGWILNMRSQINDLALQNQILSAELQDQREIFLILKAPNVVEYALQGTPVQPDAHGELYADPAQKRAVLFVSGLKRLPPGRVYQVWLIKDQTPVGLETFVVDPSGEAQLIINAPQGIGAFQLAALTEEPTGGSPQPTTEVLLVGQF